MSDPVILALGAQVMFAIPLGIMLGALRFSVIQSVIVALVGNFSFAFLISELLNA